MAWLPINEQLVNDALESTPEMSPPASAMPPSPLTPAAPPRAWFPANVVFVMVSVEPNQLAAPPPEATAPGPVPTAWLLINVLLLTLDAEARLSNAPLAPKNKPADR